jgi:hypothetical protein
MADRLKMAIGDLIRVGAGIRAVVAWVRDRGALLGDDVAVYLLSGSESRAQRRARHDVGLGSKAQSCSETTTVGRSRGCFHTCSAQSYR